jgi:Spy/CpxP family protein refolding chaperone
VLNSKEELTKVFLPHQLKMLNEMFFAGRIGNRANYGLNDKYVAKLLYLTQDQKQEIAKICLESQQELESQIKELQARIELVRKKHLDEVLKILEPEQQRQYKEKYGESPWRFWQ